MLEEGVDGVALDAQGAPKLYGRAIEEREELTEMNNLRLLLEKGASDVAMYAVGAQKL